MTTIRRWGGVGAVLLALGCGGKSTSPGASTESPAAPPAPAATAAAPAQNKTPYAVLTTSKGAIVLRLFPEAAPKTVENFIGLASGSKEWRDPNTGSSVSKPLYDGTIFHRVIPGFMIQGGDPMGNGRGGPGYQFADEFGSGKTFDKPGLLAMANAGPNTNGSQFFITLAPTPWLNNRHTIFGEVTEGQSVVEAVVAAPRSNDGSDRPLESIVVQNVKIDYR